MFNVEFVGLSAMGFPMARLLVNQYPSLKAIVERNRFNLFFHLSHCSNGLFGKQLSALTC